MNHFLFFRKTYPTEILFVVAKLNEACLYTMTIPMYLAWNGFRTCKLQRVMRQHIFLIHCAPSSPTWKDHKRNIEVEKDPNITHRNEYLDGMDGTQ